MEKDQSSNRLSNWLYIRPLEELKIAGGEAAYDNTAGERVDEEADESTIEEIVIDSIVDKIAGEGVAVRDKTAGESEAIRDKIAGGEAAHDNTVGERVDED